MTKPTKMTVSGKMAYGTQTAEIKTYIACVDKTLEIVFNMPEPRRRELIVSLRQVNEKSYWDATLHSLPLYSAAELAGVSIEYPEFDYYEEKYTQLIEGKLERMSGLGDD